MRTCPPVAGRRRENVTLRLVPRANGGRRCQSCVRQNSDSSCGSGQALLSSRDDSPQRRQRHATAEVQKETSLSSSGLGRSVDSEELPEEVVEPRIRPKLQRLPAVEDED